MPYFWLILGHRYDIIIIVYFYEKGSFNYGKVFSYLRGGDP